MRTFYSGQTAGQPNKPTDLLNYYAGLTQNWSQANLDIGTSMINDEHSVII